MAGTEIACVNGRFLPLAEAVVPIEDRGYQFADGVYEVVATYAGRPFAMEAHLARLQRSLDQIRIAYDVAAAGLQGVVEDGLRRAGFAEALVYIQVTRGVAPRHHEFPAPAPAPTVVITVKSLRRPEPRLYEEGVRVITLPDLRWKRCDIKAIALLPNILAKQQAQEAGAYEALLVDDQERITEGSSTSCFRVWRGTVYTSPLGPHILPSITRGLLIQVAGKVGIPVVERFSTAADYRAADEVFLAGTTTEAMPVVQVDEAVVGAGRPGPVTRKIRQAFLDSLGVSSRQA